MKLKQLTDNGNVAIKRQEVASHLNFNNRSWLSNNSDSLAVCDNISRTDNLQYNSNFNANDSSESAVLESIGTKIEEFVSTESSDVNAVCNKQYRLNTENKVNFLITCNNTQTANLEGATETVFALRDSYLDDTNVSTNTTPVDEERAFEQSDTDEMSENSVHPVPRGIVNPNYPGFQHLAHTLQDYSTNIENFYPSENDMTDDDIDIEIAEANYELESNQNDTLTVIKNITNYNNNNNTETPEKTLSSQNEYKNTKYSGSGIKNEIPDLIKTISKNNNNIKSNDYDFNCLDTDIENNFHTKDIIGDFNKEIEDEIKQLLNYNINIQDDLEELRKDIKDTFAKPIENTIINISDVVNHVIKKLVETRSDCNENEESKLSKETNFNKQSVEETNSVIEENESNTRTEMKLSRPTFLLIENNSEGNIKDAFLSDGKDEISIYENEYDTESLSNNVERTILQLSTELRKIIPKLDEMRERDKLWIENKVEPVSVTTDGNSNEIASSSKTYKSVPSPKTNQSDKFIRNSHNYAEISARKDVPQARIEPRIKDRQKERTATISSIRNAHNNISVRKPESAKDYDLGSFDVYNIETALPKLDLDAIESHLKAAKEAERRKHNDREEIRRRLAMGGDTEEYYSVGHIDRPGKKPSLHSRLQNGKNLQICFMNETASDNESQTSDIERNQNCNNKNMSRSSIFSKSNFNHPYQTRPLSVNITKNEITSTVQAGAKLRPSSLSLKSTKSRSSHSLGHIELKESDFYALQATLQTEARIALAQAKEMARIQMERERRSRPVSPVTEMLRRSMEKANAPLAPDRRRVSRQLLTDMNIAQLQVIVNELHSQIESLNDSLVKLLMARDELHMGQDSMLVDIEDLTRYLGVKEQTKKTKGTGKSGVRRLTSLVHK